MVDLIADTTSGAHIPALDNTMGALLSWDPIFQRNFYNQDTLRLKLLWSRHRSPNYALPFDIRMYLVSNFGNPDYLALVVCLIYVLGASWQSSRLRSSSLCVGGFGYVCQLTLSEAGMVSETNFPSYTVVVVLASFVITIEISRAVNGLNFGGDIVITFAMVYLLGTSKSGIKRVCAICSLVSISVWPNTFVYIGFYVVLARLYVNSFLATLNAREKLRALNRPPGSSFLSNLTFTDIHTYRKYDFLIIKQEVETDTHRNDIEMESFLQSKKLSFRPVDSDCVVHVTGTRVPV
ncbi:hypothetical protein BT96DRAFT_944712 [Gymnopus androsaceus JB14]|uniref:DUF6534 domain-containing protein n=1 Tax=Gymnopus androsaceus JB14 TaxID=1447944 RepID=A0A6A4H2D5_9AGAR|nr:hypothetical protein BT96DRAFT_944712 [Gymnopus androsaceus JB14]